MGNGSAVNLKCEDTCLRVARAQTITVSLSNAWDLIIGTVCTNSIFLTLFRSKYIYLKVPAQLPPWGWQLLEQLAMEQKITVNNSVTTSHMGVKG